MTLRDPQVKQTLERHFISIAVDIDKRLPEVQAYFQKLGGGALPQIVYVNERGMFLDGTKGPRNKDEFLGDLTKVLENKQYALPKKAEAELAKQVQAFEKALADKNLTKAGAAWNAIGKFRGYSTLKDKAHDLLDTAQEDASKKLEEAVGHVEKDAYGDARMTLEAAIKESAGLPIAAVAKDHLAAVKMLESVQQLATEKKGSWKQTALKNLVIVANKYADTPYAALAGKRRTEIQKP